MFKRSASLYISDAGIVLLSYALIGVLKPYHFPSYFTHYFSHILPVFVLWIPISSLYGKYRLIKAKKSIRRFMIPILQANLSILGLFALFIMLSRTGEYSNKVILSTITIATVLEILFYNTLHYTSRLHDTLDENLIVKAMHSKTMVTETRLKRLFNDIPSDRETIHKIEQSVVNEVGKEIFHMLNNWVNLYSPHCHILATTTRFNILNLEDGTKCIINLRRINDVRYLNKFFEAANDKLVDQGVLIAFAETKDLRKHRILHKYPAVINYFMYAIDFMIKRVLPKFKLTQKLYFLITRGENRVLSKAEIFGRLYSCGFEILDEVYKNNYLFFLARKIRKPHYPADPTYGPLIKLRRVGKDGKIIKVYKFRTMHPYAEYLQEYMYTKNNLQEGGKFKNDFRVSTLGRIMRKLWIDELPMIFNLLKGDIKLVGVRPLSQHYFSLYTKELQEKRLKHKPGLIPPFYADMPKTLDEIMTSEMNYLIAYEQRPLKTDIRYFFKSFYNIFFRHARSN